MVDRYVNVDQEKQTEAATKQICDKDHLFLKESCSDLENLGDSLKSILRDKRRITAVLVDEDCGRLEASSPIPPFKKAKEEEREQAISGMTSIKERLNRSVSPVKSTSRYHDTHIETASTNMSSLVEELKAARSLNRSLTEKLAQAEANLEISRKSKDEMKIEMEAKIAARGAALVDKIYTAQKERDAAVMARLKISNDERDEAIEKLKRLERDRGFDSGVESGSIIDEEMDILNYEEMSVNDLLRKVEAANDGKIIERHGSVIADRLAKAQRSNKRKAAQDDIKLLKERDDAKLQVRRLEEEIERLKTDKEEFEDRSRNNEKNRLKAYQGQLKTLARERDESESQVQALKEELQNLKIYYSLHKSLSQEQSLRDQFNSTMDNFEGKIKLKEEEIQHAQRSYDDVIAKLNAVIREKSAIASQLQETLQQLKEEQLKSDKLERLVVVLRKRITGSVEGL